MVDLSIRKLFVVWIKKLMVRKVTLHGPHIEKKNVSVDRENVPHSTQGTYKYSMYPIVRLCNDDLDQAGHLFETPGLKEPLKSL